jgi:hypothetical protein
MDRQTLVALPSALRPRQPSARPSQPHPLLHCGYSFPGHAHLPTYTVSRACRLDRAPARSGTLCMCNHAQVRCRMTLNTFAPVSRASVSAIPCFEAHAGLSDRSLHSPSSICHHMPPTPLQLVRTRQNRADALGSRFCRGPVHHQVPIAPSQV